MKTLLCTVLLVSCSTSFAQIHLILSDFATKNDTVRMSEATPTTIDFSTTGANQTWDFSNLNPTSQTLIHFPDMSSAGPLAGFEFGAFSPPQYRADYYLPATDLPIGTIGNLLPTIQIEDVFRYFNRIDTAINAVGLSISTSMGNIPKKSDTIETYYKIPLDYSDHYTSRGYTNMDFNPFFDAIYIQHRGRNTTVDGYGTINTPFGSFQALRVHHIINEVDSFYINYSGFSQWIPIPVPTSHEYEWWAKDQKLPVMKIVTTEVGGNETVTKITYRDKFRYDLVASIAENKAIEIGIYPNPASDKLTIKANQPIQKIALFNLNGQLLMEKSFNSSEKAIIDVSNFTKGQYFVVSYLASGSFYKTRFQVK